MKRDIVIIETPYAGDIKRNVAYARACMRDSLLRGEAPYASHLLYTQPGVFRDDDPSERRAGIEAGFAFRRAAKATAVYEDLGISPGMLEGIAHSEASGVEVVYRRLGQWQRCTGCKERWDEAELDDDGRCWACAARHRNAKRGAK